MRRRDKVRRMRAELAWMLAGLAAVQLGLGLGVDCFWPGVRDPEFAALLRRLEERRAEAPGRPLVVALGSSRTETGLDAGRLSRDAAGPLVFNLGVPTAGPMFQRVVLRRLLDRGVRPDLVFVEVMPEAMSGGGRLPVEEHMLDPARLDGAEAARLLRAYRAPRLLWRWAADRAVPVYRHQAELREALGLDRPGDGGATDGYGWRRLPTETPAGRAARLHGALGQYADALRDPEPGKEPLRALRALLALCRREHVPAAVIFPPESSAFRTAAADHAARIEAAVRAAARDFDAPAYDALAWVDDDGFWDGHHLAPDGAERYTERFGREVLAPEMRRVAGRRLAVDRAITTP